MEINAKRWPFLPLVFLFLLVNLLLLVLRLCFANSVPFAILAIGNGLLFLSSLISFRLVRKGLFHQNVHVFVRMIYGGMFLKMLICLAATLVYVVVAGSGVSRMAIFSCFGLYFMYSFVEVKILLRLSKEKKNA